MTHVESYRDLFVWQMSMEVVECIYALTRRFPSSEAYGLTSQMRRAAISIPSNIAEGRRRGSRKDFRQFIVVAYGSGAELETQVEIAKRLKFVRREDCVKLDRLLDEVMRMLNSIVLKLGS